jgi:hypothetical protein
VSDLENVNSLNGNNAGPLIFITKKLIVTPNFIDYLQSGWTISITTAIDYTGSNGNYTRPDSLHFLGPQN